MAIPLVHLPAKSSTDASESRSSSSSSSPPLHQADGVNRPSSISLKSLQSDLLPPLTVHTSNPPPSSPIICLVFSSTSFVFPSSLIHSCRLASGTASSTLPTRCWGALQPPLSSSYPWRRCLPPASSLWFWLCVSASGFSKALRSSSADLISSFHGRFSTTSLLAWQPTSAPPRKNGMTHVCVCDLESTCVGKCTNKSRLLRTDTPVDQRKKRTD